MQEQEQEEVGDLSLAGRMARVFHAPADTFEAVRLRVGWPDWLVPTVVVIAVGLGAMLVAMPVYQRTQQAVLAEKLKDVPAEQREAAIRYAQTLGTVGLVVGLPLMYVAMLLVGGGVLLLVGRWGMGGAMAFPQALAVCAYASLVQVLAWLVRTPLMLARDTTAVHLGPAVLLPEADLGTFAGRFVVQIDLFVVWQLGIAAVGVAVLTRGSALRAFTILAGVWLLWLVMSAALGGIHLGPTPPTRG